MPSIDPCQTSPSTALENGESAGAEACTAAYEPLPERTAAQLAALLPFPAPDANKYTRGKLTLVAGSAAYPGAACLAAAGAQRAGAGYTEVFCAGKSMITVRAWRPSLVVRDWHTWQPAQLPAPKPGHPVACVVGCGFDAQDRTQEPLLMQTLRAFPGPVLVDGGALGILASSTGLRLAKERAETGQPLVLTPHGGEAARLAKAARLPHFEEPQQLAAALAATYQATVALKGPTTYIATPEGTVEPMTRGTAALAKAGTGDVLAGIIGALLAQGLTPADAAALGTALHAEAGKAAAKDLTEISVEAEDIPAYLPQAIKEISQAPGGAASADL